MLTRIVTTFVLAVTVVAAQGRDAGGSGAPPMGGTQTPFEQFVDRLRLDAKTQLPAVQRIFTETATQASSVGQEMVRLRQQALDAYLAAKPDAAKQALDAYTIAAAKMTGFEAKAFGDVYALLKPNQQSKAPQAFELMGGLFNPPPATSRGRRGGGDR